CSERRDPEWRGFYRPPSETGRRRSSSPPSAIARRPARRTCTGQVRPLLRRLLLAQPSLSRLPFRRSSQQGGTACRYAENTRGRTPHLAQAAPRLAAVLLWKDAGQAGPTGRGAERTAACCLRGSRDLETALRFSCPIGRAVIRRGE